VRTAREAISEPVVTVSPSAGIRDALVALLDENVSHVLVAHRAAMPEGVVADIDIVRLGGRR
jgi:signal-transduction protein with cAMP-binding, CBS, and nucleotidyltransferase domain